LILVIVGLMYGFDRLIMAADNLAELIDEEFIMQIGESSYEPKNARYFRYISADQIDKLYSQSRIVICHAGVGTILTAREHRKPVIVMPRRKNLGEHLDDHQFEIANELILSGNISVVNDFQSLKEAFLKLDKNTTIINEPNKNIIDSLKDYIKSLDG